MYTFTIAKQNSQNNNRTLFLNKSFVHAIIKRIITNYQTRKIQRHRQLIGCTEKK